MASGAVIAIQDMGAAGLTCSAVEMGAKGDLGVELHLEKVPTREEGMTPYEMNAVREPGAHAHGAQARHGGRGRSDLREVGPRLRDHRPHHGYAPLRHQAQRETVADLPIKELGVEPRSYDRPHIANTHQPVIAAADVAAPVRTPRP